MRARFTSDKWGTDSLCFYEPRIRAGLQPLLVWAIAARYFTVREGHAISNIMCLAHFGTVRPKTLPYYIEGENLKNLTEKGQSLQLREAVFRSTRFFSYLNKVNGDH